jgi:hypothetical protein
MAHLEIDIESGVHIEEESWEWETERAFTMGCMGRVLCTSIGLISPPDHIQGKVIRDVFG